MISDKVGDRWWGTADTCRIGAFEGGDVVVTLEWADGAFVQWFEPSAPAAAIALAPLGWAAP